MSPKAIISIPSELITEILYRLPSKSVGRFRCVSKDWLSLLSSPKFIKIHQNILNQNHIIFKSNDFIVPYLIPLHHYEEEEAVPVEFRLDLPYIKLIFDGCCNGLVLLSVYHRGILVISNPTTREFVVLPHRSYGVAGIHVRCEVGLCYNSVTDDYMVVTISYVRHYYPGCPDCMYVDVYSLRTNIWTQVTDYPYKHYYLTSKPVAFVDGFLHWITMDSNVLIVVAFSLADEKFSEVPSPNDFDKLFNYDCELVVLGGKLAICMEGEIWLMKEYGVKESWTNIILHGLNETPIHRPMIFDYNGKVMLLSDDQILMYDIEEGRLCKRMNASRNLKDLKVRAMCVESLVSLKFS